jgi:hypothetical protein
VRRIRLIRVPGDIDVSWTAWSTRYRGFDPHPSESRCDPRRPVVTRVMVILFLSFSFIVFRVMARTVEKNGRVQCNPEGAGRRAVRRQIRERSDRVPELSEDRPRSGLRVARTDVRCRRLHGRNNQARRARQRSSAAPPGSAATRLPCLPALTLRLEADSEREKAPGLVRNGGNLTPGGCTTSGGTSRG